MWHTVGPHSRAVYWRRRLVVLAALVAVVLLIILTARALFAHGDEKQQGTGAVTPSSTPTTTTTPTGDGTGAGQPVPGGQSGQGGQGSQSSTGAGGESATAPSTGSATGTEPPTACTPQQLQVQAVVGKEQYSVGEHPTLILQVTNTGPKPCVQDVADSQIELSVYNGASRVWGSHDCQTEPGVDKRTLEVNQPAGFSIEWSGLTAQPGCEGTRQRVGAGTYTLYAALSGEQGKAAQFSIS